MPLPGLIPPISRSQPCQRCGKRYPRRSEACPHCSDLSDAELEAYREDSDERREGSRSLGWGLLLVAAGLVGLVIVIGLAD
jgi:hypothetical protein